MKPAFHRSITFWSGLLVMGFICWAWWDSMSHLTNWSVLEVGGQHYQSAIVLGPATGSSLVRKPSSAYPVEEPEYFAAPFFERGGGRQDHEILNRIEAGQRTFREKSFGIMPRQPPDLWMLFIPHWLILLTVAIPWLVLLVWRARRRAAAAKP